MPSRLRRPLLQIPDGEATTVGLMFAYSDKQELAWSVRELREIHPCLSRQSKAWDV